MRKDTEVQELRQWQREWREETHGVQEKVTDFWEKKMPGGGEPTPADSEDNINKENIDSIVKPPSPVAVSEGDAAN